MLTVVVLVVQERTNMGIMTYSKAKTKCEGIINSFNNCDKLYKDCSECPLNKMLLVTGNEEYVTMCHLLSFFREDLKDKIDKALS